MHEKGQGGTIEPNRGKVNGIFVKRNRDEEEEEEEYERVEKRERNSNEGELGLQRVRKIKKFSIWDKHA